MGTEFYDELDKKYQGVKVRAYTFFKDPENLDAPTTMRFEVSNPKWEFSYGKPDGPAVQGTFFYKRGFFDGENPRLSKYDATQASFQVLQKVEKKVLFLHVEFYAPGSESELLGEFLAQDSLNASGNSGLKGKPLDGHWKFLSGDSLYDRLDKEYKQRKEGEALFLKSGVNSDGPSFRFNANELGWQLTYSDPRQEVGIRGTLFYKDGFFDGDNPVLPKNQTTKAGFLVEKKKEKGESHVLIKFYAPGPRDDLLGEFLAKDPENQAGNFEELLGKSNEGTWKFVGTESLEMQLQKKYGRVTLAEAIFSKSPFKVSLRFEVYERSWEFSEDRFVGHRIVGVLFHDDDTFGGSNPKLSKGAPIEANYLVGRIEEKEVRYAHIMFYAPGSQGLLGEFVGRDPRDTLGGSALSCEIKKGIWRKIGYTTATATVSKFANATQVTLSIGDKVAKMESGRHSEIYDDAIDGVSGLLTIKNPGALGKVVRWYKDRAVFYEDDKSEDFTAFFLTNDAFEELGSKDGMEWNVNWERKE